MKQNFKNAMRRKQLQSQGKSNLDRSSDSGGGDDMGFSQFQELSSSSSEDQKSSQQQSRSNYRGSFNVRGRPTVAAAASSNNVEEN